MLMLAGRGVNNETAATATTPTVVPMTPPKLERLNHHT